MHNLKPQYINKTKENRLYHIENPIIGLTGGIASGKSTVASLLEELGAFIINADHLVKEIYKYPETVNYIEKNFPEVMENKTTISFPKLRKLFFSNLEAKEMVQARIYEELPKAFKNKAANKKDVNVIIYDAPLIFENNIQLKIDQTILVTCNKETQISRVMKRDQISRELAESIIEQQMSLAAKEKIATITIQNDQSIEALKTQIQVLKSKLFL